jgi:hypothetical protein
MAITKDRQVQRLEVYPAADASADATLNQAHPHIMVCYNDVMDDPDDDDLPVIAQRTKHIHKYVEDGGDATDYSGEDELVQDICGLIWS